MRYDIAIVTVSTNKLDEECLVSVKRLIESTPLKVCFVLVDNASTQFDAHGLVKNILPNAIVLLRGRNHGFGRSCNRGAQEVDAEYLFFLNPDTRITDTLLLKKLHDQMRALPKLGMVAPRIFYMDGRIQETCRRFPDWFTPIVQRTSMFFKRRREMHRERFLMEDFGHDRRRLVEWVQGSAFMIDAALFHELKGFDDRFWMYYEDVDLCRRSWEKGRPVYYVPEAELYHAYGKESSTDGGVFKGIFHNAKAQTHIASWLKYTWKWKGKTL